MLSHIDIKEPAHKLLAFKFRKTEQCEVQEELRSLWWQLDHFSLQIKTDVEAYVYDHLNF